MGCQCELLWANSHGLSKLHTLAKVHCQVNAFQPNA